MCIRDSTYYINKSKKKSSTVLTYSIKLLSLYTLLICTVATIPLFDIFLTTIYCKTNFVVDVSQCYSGIYYLHFIIAIFGLLILLIFSITFTLLYVDLNPNSTIPFAAPQSKINLFRLLMKIALPLYFVLDYQSSLESQYIIVLALYYFCLLIIRYRTTPEYNKSISQFIVLCETSLLWITICVAITAILDADASNSLVVLYLFIGIPFTAYFTIEVMEKRRWRMMKTDIRQLKKDSDVEMYVNVLLELIEHKDKTEYRIQLEGVLKHHIRTCVRVKDGCTCTQLANDNDRDEDNTEKQLKWYTLVKYVLVDCIERFQKSARLHMLYAYLQHEKLKNKYKALYELMITEDNKPCLLYTSPSPRDQA
eukprot:TRINITY_DN13074_c0_g1_i1.p1 TRINITY_DN13074_c0_g1~~TRINITY_DN13074_c0_g1_i1.p1  ORF type:complete len:387 (-),score=108.36 TRINITY_DN13074_c0_g1_i1:34-1131(-)